MNLADTAPAFRVDESVVTGYRERGVVRVPGILSRDEAAHYATAAERIWRDGSARFVTPGAQGGTIFDQFINVWQRDPVMRELTLLERLHAVAEQLAGVPLRVWHDHMLIKPPHNQASTEFHQDQPYWPHATTRHALSAWIALVDVPVERGCMTFIPGSQSITGLRPQDLASDTDLLSLVPELTWQERVTLPLQAGDCTFHNSYTAHMATPNQTDDPRFAHIVAFMDADTTFSGEIHPVTGPLGLEAGTRLDGEHFPRPGH